MIKIDDLVKTIRTKGPVETKTAGSQDAEKSPDELKIELLEKELLENREAMQASLVKKSKEPAKKEPISDLEVFTTKPMPVSNPNIECPFCGEEKSPKGMGRHVAAIHQVEGVSIEDLESVEKGEKNPRDLVEEKAEYEGEAVVFGLSPEVSKKYFSDWSDLKESEIDDQESAEIEKEIDGQEDKNNPGPPGSPACYENPGEKNPGQENPVERRKFNWIPFFSPFNRRSYRQ